MTDGRLSLSHAACGGGCGCDMINFPAVLMTICQQARFEKHKEHKPDLVLVSFGAD